DHRYTVPDPSGRRLRRHQSTKLTLQAFCCGSCGDLRIDHVRLRLNALGDRQRMPPATSEDHDHPNADCEWLLKTHVKLLDSSIETRVQVKALPCRATRMVWSLPPPYPTAPQSRSFAPICL